MKTCPVNFEGKVIYWYRAVCFKRKETITIFVDYPTATTVYLSDKDQFNRRQTPMAVFQTVFGLADEHLGPTYGDLYGVAKRSGIYHHPGVLNG